MAQATWAELPKEIKDRMLDEQVRQGNKRDESVFVKDIFANKSLGGFYWDETDCEDEFIQAISFSNFQTFFNRYPKKNIELDPKKVCIKGDGTVEYGAKIKAYLEKLGGEDYYKFNFDMGDMYFINEKGHIDLLSNSEGYHEISLKDTFEVKEDSSNNIAPSALLHVNSEPDKPKPIYMVDGVTYDDLAFAEEHAREVAMLNGTAVVYKYVSLFEKDIKINKTEY